MSAAPQSCAEHIQSLKQQVSVMRREMKNLRQRVDSAVRAHRKHTASLQALLTNTPPTHQSPAQPVCGTASSLEHGHIQTVPIGYITSCFANKNGTPRQPTVCMASRASLQIRTEVFNNPAHALTGLEHYSHVWLIFLFHKNGHMSYKAKVKPPRLNGRKVGVYSTRSPHRPNAIGLTLATLEGITGDTLHLSGVDLIAGTPVLDVKPYIPDYDSPGTRLHTETQSQQRGASDTYQTPSNPPTLEIEPECAERSSDSSSGLQSEQTLSAAAGEVGARGSLLCGSADPSKVLAEVRGYLQQGESFGESLAVEETTDTAVPSESECERESKLCFGAEAHSSIAAWIRDPPVSTLSVRFTPNAEEDLRQFAPPESTDPDRPKFHFLKGAEEAAAGIRAVLSADPRSVYRRTRCGDRLFFFSLDTLDVTCWFGDGFAEVLRVRPVNSTQE